MNPSASSELIVNAQSVRARLRNPSNAVRDDGIDLKRLPRGFELARRKILREAETIEVEPETPIPHEPTFRPAVTLSAFFVAKLIIDHVAAAYDLNAEAIKSAVRTDRLVKPRQLAMYLMREITKRSLPWVGRQFRRDHTTVLHGIGQVKHRINSDLAFAAEVVALECSIRKLIA